MVKLNDQEKRLFWTWHDCGRKPFDTAEALGIEPDAVTAAMRAINRKLDAQLAAIAPRRRAELEAA